MRNGGAILAINAIRWAIGDNGRSMLSDLPSVVEKAIAEANARGIAEGMERAAKWHEAEIAKLEKRVEENTDYARRSGNKDGSANSFCFILIGSHQLSAKAIRQQKERDNG